MMTLIMQANTRQCSLDSILESTSIDSVLQDNSFDSIDSVLQDNHFALHLDSDLFDNFTQDCDDIQHETCQIQDQDDVLAELILSIHVMLERDAIPLKKKQVCAHCQTSNTPVWRRDDTNNTVCNACGLYYKMHKTRRPEKKRRVRSRKNSTASSQGSDSSSPCLDELF